jgi:hypothetical protein
MAAKPVPDGYHTVTPYLTVRGAAKVIEFLKQAFGAEIPEEIMKRPDGSLREQLGHGHAQRGHRAAGAAEARGGLLQGEAQGGVGRR